MGFIYGSILFECWKNKKLIFFWKQKISSPHIDKIKFVGAETHDTHNDNNSC